MVHIRVDASEWDRLTVDMHAGLGRIGAQGAALVRASTYICEAYAILGAPVDTGFLKGSIGSSFSGDGRTGSMVGEVTAHAGYSYWVEFGTSRMAPQPFMGPALQLTAPSFISGAASIGAGLLRGGAG